MLSQERLAEADTVLQLLETDADRKRKETHNRAAFAGKIADRVVAVSAQPDLQKLDVLQISAAIE